MARGVPAAGGCRGGYFLGELVLAGQEGLRIADGRHGRQIDGGRGGGGARGRRRQVLRGRGRLGRRVVAVSSAEKGGSAREEALLDGGLVGHGS